MGVDVAKCTTAEYKAAVRNMTTAEHADAALARRRYQSRKAAAKARARRARKQGAYATTVQFYKERRQPEHKPRNLLAEIYARQHLMCHSGSCDINPYDMVGSPEESCTSLLGTDSWQVFVSTSKGLAPQ